MEKLIEYSWTVPSGEPLSACWKKRDIFDEVLRKYLPREPTHFSGSDQGTEITKVYSLEALTVFVVKEFRNCQLLPEEQGHTHEWDAQKTKPHPYHRGTTRVHLFYGSEKKDLAEKIWNELEQKKAFLSNPGSPAPSTKHRL